MKRIFIILLALLSFPFFARANDCLKRVEAEVLMTPTMKERMSLLLSNLSRVDYNGDIIIDEEIMLQIEGISTKVKQLAELACREIPRD